MDPILDDDLSKLEAEQTSHVLPAGWVLFAAALVVWGAVYLWKYMPGLGGWSQAGELDGAGTSSGASLLATIGYTAAATVVALALVLVQRRKGRR